MSLGRELQGPPSDGVTSLRFYADTTLLLASSWDGTVRLWDAREGAPRSTWTQPSPVLDAAFESSSAVLSGALDHTVRRYDFAAGQETAVGSHEAAVRCVEWLPSLGLVASGGWDSTLRLWDLRAAPGGQGAVATIQLPGKVYTMAQSETRLVVGTSGRHIDVFDLRTIRSGQAEQQRESSLKWQTRCVRCHPDGTSFAVASIEGRVGMEYFDQTEEAQARKYAFKCHRGSEGGRDRVYPVNALAFNAAYGTFATGGGDGTVNIWDGRQKKRLQQVAGYPTSISALAFNASATLLAVAASYTYEQGEREHPQDSIYIREVTEAEVKPKALA